MEKFSITELEWIGITMRRIWLRRNEFVFENKLCSPKSVIQAANVMLNWPKKIQL